MIYESKYSPLITHNAQQHIHNWNQCQLCTIGKECHKHLLWRGHMPCDILFIGDAPSLVDDSLGYAFTGPPGNLLQAIINILVTDSIINTYALTNIVACLPQTNGKLRHTSKKETENCKPRLLEFIRLASPAFIVTLGKIAQRNLPQLEGSYIVENIEHPTSVLTKFDPNASHIYILRTVAKLKHMIESNT